jgi:hypothetical protein
MKKLLAAEFSTVKKWWSVWIGGITTFLLIAIPIAAEKWPDLAPTFVAWFPKGGEQWAPVVGLLLTIAARIISQRFVIDVLRRLFNTKVDIEHE